MRPPPFHERFDISVSSADAKRKFMNRVSDLVFRGLDYYRKSEGPDRLIGFVAFFLGDLRPSIYEPGVYFDQRAGGDFVSTLKVLEAVYLGLNDEGKEELDETIPALLDMAEVDLNVRWDTGVFYRKGAEELDEALINLPLKWLRDRGSQNVLQPFQKGLSHLLEASSRPDLYFDSVTDFYEALEALAKLVTDKDKDLSSNAESFIKALKVSKGYKVHLRSSIKSYIAYANDFRHATGNGVPRPSLSELEVESFMYSTGLFLRLGLQSIGNEASDASAA